MVTLGEKLPLAGQGAGGARHSLFLDLGIGCKVCLC